MESVGLSAAFWSGRRVLVTGHTGFKGSWLGLWLAQLGAKVAGYALAPPTSPALHDLAGVASDLSDVTLADLRDGPRLRESIARFDPEIVFHLAAQPIVRRSFSDPLETLSVNVLGTAMLLDALREAPGARVAIVVTSDKCYAETAAETPHGEDDRLGGVSPYACSKACAELVTDSFRASYFPHGSRLRIASARAGNVIGGGDWAEDRLVPDIARAAGTGMAVALRHPDAVRPWQHVLDPLAGYLLLAQSAWDDARYGSAWNFGPAAADCRTVHWIAGKVASALNVRLERESGAGLVPETGVLRIDAAKAQRELGWRQRLPVEESVEWTSAWYQGHLRAENARQLTLDQIQRYQQRWPVQ